MLNAGAVLRSKPVLLSGVIVAFAGIMTLLSALPLSVASPSTGEVQATPQATENGMKNKMIAYVDDGESWLATVPFIISDALPGVKVQAYPTVELLLADPTIQPSLIILDGEIGDTFGWNYIPTLRSRWPTAKIVGLSGMRGGADLFKAADAFQPKNSDWITQLPKLIQELLK